MGMPNWMTFDERTEASPILRSMMQDMEAIGVEGRNWKRFSFVCVIIVFVAILKGASAWICFAAIGGQVLSLICLIRLKQEHKNRVAQAYKDLVARLGEKSGKRLCSELQIEEDGSLAGG